MATPTNLPAAEVAFTPLAASWLNDLRGAFRILQVGATSTLTQSSSTSATYANTALFATITPQSASNRILVMVTGSAFSSSALTEASIRLVRDFGGITPLQTVPAAYSSAGAVIGTYTFIYLDNPNTTSALTYRTQLARASGSGIAYDEINGSLTTITVMEVSL